VDGVSEALPEPNALGAPRASHRRRLIPHVARVAAVRPFEGNALAVDLVPSQARHVLKLETPDRDELERRLREAERAGSTVVVTETDAHEIIDVRDYTPDPELPPVPFFLNGPFRCPSRRALSPSCGRGSDESGSGFAGCGGGGVASSTSSRRRGPERSSTQ
jgi:hypothetical protein